MNERIKSIRKKLGLTQTEFAERIGTVQNTIAGYESGRRIPSNIVISSICREFNVNEGWLRNGTGEMFLDLTEDEFIKAAALLSNDKFIRGLLIEYWKLDEDSKNLFKNFIHNLSDTIREQD